MWRLAVFLLLLLGGLAVPPGAVLAQSGAEAPARDGVGELFLGQPQDSPAAEGAAAELTARGVLEPAAEAVISSELSARIAELPFDEGDAFAAGAVLVAFDCALFEARRGQAAALLRAARAKLANARQLQQMNSIGELEVSLAQAEVARTAAAVTEAEVAVQRCTIPAPFDGRVVEKLANAHEVAAPGVELLSIVSAGAPEATLLVPSAWLTWLEPGQRFAFRVDETGAELPGAVTAIGARVDPVSQTVPLRVELEAAGQTGDTRLIPGMSGTARFAPPAKPGG